RIMIEKYLTLKWQEGALAGVSPKSSFYVNCGFGGTMTSKDILNGGMNIEVGLAILRPGEFYVMQISHQQKVLKRRPEFVLGNAKLKIGIDS
ncbi:MAG: hypothetical protein WCP08_11810, partial [Prolixibacteraceae bacterium]